MSEPMSDERLEQIQARAVAATPGPWDCYGDGAYEVFDAGEYRDGDPGEVVAPVVTKLNDAEFIAHARGDIPALLAEVARLREALTITDEMVERVAKARYLASYEGDPFSLEWDELCERFPEDVYLFRREVRATLEAALGVEK